MGKLNTTKHIMISEQLEADIRNGVFEEVTGAPLTPETDRVMICGSMAMLKEHKQICEDAGMAEGSNSEPGQFVIEKAFTD